MIPLKTQLEKLKEGCHDLFDLNEKVCGRIEIFTENTDIKVYCPICQAKISLLSQIIDDLKKWIKSDEVKNIIGKQIYDCGDSDIAVEELLKELK